MEHYTWDFILDRILNSYLNSWSPGCRLRTQGKTAFLSLREIQEIFYHKWLKLVSSS